MLHFKVFIFMNRWTFCAVVHTALSSNVCHGHICYSVNDHLDERNNVNAIHRKFATVFHLEVHFYINATSESALILSIGCAHFSYQRSCWCIAISALSIFGCSLFSRLHVPFLILYFTEPLSVEWGRSNKMDLICILQKGFPSKKMCSERMRQPGE